MTLNSNTNRSRHPSSCAATPALAQLKDLRYPLVLSDHTWGVTGTRVYGRCARHTRSARLSLESTAQNSITWQGQVANNNSTRFESGPTWTNTQCSCWSNRKLLVDCSSGTTHQNTLTKQRKQSVCWRFDEFVRHVFSRRLLVFFSMIDVTWYYYSRSNEWSASQPIGIECPRY